MSVMTKAHEADEERLPLKVIIDQTNPGGGRVSSAYDSAKVSPKSSTDPGSKSNAGLIGSVVAFYWMVSLSVVFLNKWILSSSEYKFPYPLIVTLYQLVVALGLLVGCGHFGQTYS